MGLCTVLDTMGFDMGIVNKRYAYDGALGPIPTLGGSFNFCEGGVRCGGDGETLPYQGNTVRVHDVPGVEGLNPAPSGEESE